jgi:hypothetical protein
MSHVTPHACVLTANARVLTARVPGRERTQGRPLAAAGRSAPGEEAPARVGLQPSVRSEWRRLLAQAEEEVYEVKPCLWSRGFPFYRIALVLVCAGVGLVALGGLGSRRRC